MSEQLYPRPLSGDIVVNLPSARLPARSPLVGQAITLEPLDAAMHAEGLYHASHVQEQGEHVWDYLTHGPWSDLQSYAAFIRTQSASQDTIFYALRDHRSDAICGQASFLDINAGMGSIEIGHIWFGPSLQQTRAATEALYLMITHALDDLDYRRMQWRCNSLNAKSRAAAMRLGFRFEGVSYNHMIAKGKNRDTAWYSILDNEWPSAKAQLDAWLADENFDAVGVAKSSLRNLMDNRGDDAWPRV